ncbi:hypothetical protein MKW92_026962 [Papaver armeniacum]|nr:hypothetical protein MKW92_026962 [Papaver armeniacum]
MDWVFKPTSRNKDSSNVPIVRSSSIRGKQNSTTTTTTGDYSVDLNHQWQDPRVTIASSSSSTLPSKKARTPPSSNETQIPSCLVDGCTADLSLCRDYHRRHKVCEAHSKTPIVLINGQEQRFCQQCSRFHSLLEFDDGKRSCRKRLDGHNRRRRKCHTEPLNSGSIFSDNQGNSYLQFSNPQLFQSTTAGSSRHTMTAKDDTDLYGRGQYGDGKNQIPRSFSCNFNGGKQYPFFHGDNPALVNHVAIPTVPFSQPHNTGATYSQSSKAGKKVLFSDGFNDRVVLDSNSASSLLSSPPTQPLSRQSSGFGQADIVHTNAIPPMAHPLAGGSLQLDGLLGFGRYQSQGLEGEPPSLNSSRGIFHLGLDGSMEHGAFSWKQ